MVEAAGIEPASFRSVQPGCILTRYIIYRQ